MEPHRSRAGVVVGVVVTLALGLAACGGGSPSVSSVSGCSPSGCSSPAASATLEAIALKFSVCMRSHGVSGFPDPTLGPNGLPSWTSSESRPSPAFQGARKVCGKDLPGLGLNTPAGKATANADALKYATCMRSQGLPTFPDPNGQGVLVIQTGDVQVNSPAFLKAQTACKSLDNGFGEASTASTPAP